MAVDWEQYAVKDNSPASSTDWDKYAVPENSQMVEPTSDIPWYLKVAMSLQNPMTKAIPQRSEAIKRGGQDIGEGGKQLYLGAREGLGYEKPGTLQDYTRQIQKEREEYEKSAGGQDFISQILRGVIANAPSMALGGIGGIAGKGLLGRMLGAGAGTTLGGTMEFTPEGESKAKHALTSGAIGAAVPAIPAAYRATEKVFQKVNPMQLRSKNIANEIVAAKNSAKELYKNKYNTLFDEGRSSGDMQVLSMPKSSELKIIKDNFPKKYIERLNEFMSTKDAEVGHKAQSDLNKYISILERKKLTSGLSSGEIDAMDEANKVVKHIRSSLFPNNKKLQSEYGKITEGYAKDVIPYGESSIKDYEKGDIYARKLVKSLGENPKLSEKHKKIGIRNKVLPYAATGIVGAEGLHQAYNLMNYLLGKK